MTMNASAPPAPPVPPDAGAPRWAWLPPIGSWQYYTLLAVNAVNDRDLLPDEYAGLLEDRQGLEAQIEAQAPTRRTKREL